MKIQIREYVIALAFTLSAQAHASQDCSSEVKDAVDDCTTITQTAEQANSDVASGLASNPANINKGGTSLSQVSDFGRENLGSASKQCGTDLDTCKKACGDAFAAATDSATQAAINKNMNSCQTQITSNQTRLTAGQTQLASASQGAQLTSAGSQFDDSSIDKAQAPADVQQTGFIASATAACKIGAVLAGCYANPGAQATLSDAYTRPAVIRIQPMGQTFGN